jgi:hypothetical protein
MLHEGIWFSMDTWDQRWMPHLQLYTDLTNARIMHGDTGNMQGGGSVDKLVADNCTNFAARLYFMYNKD